MLLTDNQFFAATHQKGPLIIVAGPGTGKTQTLAARVNFLIEKEKIPAEKILVVTFTNKAAQELKNRIVNDANEASARCTKRSEVHTNINYRRQNIECDLGNKKPYIGTIHSLCAKILASGIKNFEINPENFDELLRKTLEYLENNKSGLEFWQNQFEHVLIDEYQDIDDTQYKILKKLCEPHRNITAIGDPDQAIYSFRGANIQNFLSFEKDYPGTTQIALEKNFRSTKTIVKASNVLIQQNTERVEKNLITENPDGKKITVAHVENPLKEGYFIIREIERLMGGTSHYQFYKNHVDASEELENYFFGDFAILIRVKDQAGILRKCFSRSGIPVQIIGEKNPFETKEGEEILKAVKSFNIDAPDIKLTNKEKNLSSQIKNFFQEKNYEDARCMQILTFSQQFDQLSPEEAREKFLRQAKNATALDFWNPDANAVTLMTCHAAKGLEFKVVFIAGAEESLFPYPRNENLEEERRLFYVAMTRAKERLYITHAKNRMFYGKIHEQCPSRFLNELPKEYIENKMYWRRHSKTEAKKNQVTLFE